MKNILKLFITIFSFVFVSNFALAQDDSYTGIGVYLNDNRPADTYPTVERVVAYSPAARFRIQPGDKLMSVGSYDTIHMNNEDIINLLRGPAGSQVTVIVQNNSVNRACTIMRNIISETNPPPVYYANPYYGNQQFLYPYYYGRPYYSNGNYARNISYNPNPQQNNNSNSNTTTTNSGNTSRMGHNDCEIITRNSGESMRLLRE